MNISKLSASERLALYGAVATVVGATIAAASYPRHWGLTWLAAILGLAMLAIIFLPQMSPTTKLPGNKGSLLLVVGGGCGHPPAGTPLARASSAGHRGAFFCCVSFII